MLDYNNGHIMINDNIFDMWKSKNKALYQCESISDKGDLERIINSFSIGIIRIMNLLLKIIKLFSKILLSKSKSNSLSILPSDTYIPIIICKLCK